MLILIDLFSWVSPIRSWGGQVYRELIISNDVNDKGTILDLFHGSASLQKGLLTILADHSGGGALRPVWVDGCPLPMSNIRVN